MKQIVKRVLRNIKDAVFPENYTCIICNDELNRDCRYSICDRCTDIVEWIGDKACQKCGAKLIADSVVCTDCKDTERVVEKNYSAVTYDDRMRDLVYGFKYSNKRFLKKPLGLILYDKYDEVREEYNADIIIPIPLHKERLRIRGYNQTELLLSQFEEDKDKIVTDAVVRIKDTPHLASMSKLVRRDKIKGSFEVVNKEIFKGKRVLIVDDVYTTGATIDECAKLIYKCGASVVRSLTLANSHIERPIGSNKQ